MSEHVTTAKRWQYCDICGLRISKGEPIRIIRDDYMPGLTRFEHIVCPGVPAEANETHFNPLKIKKVNQGAISWQR